MASSATSRLYHHFERHHECPARRHRDLPVIEVHFTNIHGREEFRGHSYVSKVAVAAVAGVWMHGYQLVLWHTARLVNC